MILSFSKLLNIANESLNMWFEQSDFWVNKSDGFYELDQLIQIISEYCHISLYTNNHVTSEDLEYSTQVTCITFIIFYGNLLPVTLCFCH